MVPHELFRQQLFLKKDEFFGVFFFSFNRVHSEVVKFRITGCYEVKIIDIFKNLDKSGEVCLSWSIRSQNSIESVSE